MFIGSMKDNKIQQLIGFKLLNMVVPNIVLKLFNMEEEEDNSPTEVRCSRGQDMEINLSKEEDILIKVQPISRINHGGNQTLQAEDHMLEATLPIIPIRPVPTVSY